MDEIKMANIMQTMKALEKNNMKAYLAQNRNKAKDLVLSMIKKTDLVGAGGSMTLDECKVRDELREKGYRFLDWFLPGISKEEKTKIRKKSLTCDVFLSSTNALTENGELYNIDGYGNRVAAMIYGPDKVIVVAGKNKIVKDMGEAKERLETVAGPLNAKRLNKKTGCAKTGYCVDCDSPDRICCHKVVQDWQRQERIHVIIVNEDLGL